MRVLHIIATMSRNDGGPTVAIVRMANALATRGLAVTVGTTHSRWSAEERRERILERFPPSISVLTFPAWPLIQPRGFSPRMLSWLKQCSTSFDVVHLHSMFSWHSLAVPAICRARSIPFVIRPFGTLDQWSRAQKSWKKGPYFELVEKRNLRDAARIHVTSDAELQSIKELGFGAKARCIPIGLELPVLHRSRRAPEQGLRILFLSRLHPKKNLPALLHAMCDTRFFTHPPTLTVAGDGESSYVIELRRLANTLGLGKQVRFVGFVEGQVKERLYAESDVFALPSFQENFGIAVAEAMAHGLPVVISAAVALAPRVAATGAGTITADMSPAAVASALAGYEDAAAWSHASAAARGLVAAELSDDTMAQGLISMYREIRPYA